MLLKCLCAEKFKIELKMKFQSWESWPASQLIIFKNMATHYYHDYIQHQTFVVYRPQIRRRISRKELF